MKPPSFLNVLSLGGGLLSILVIGFMADSKPIGQVRSVELAAMGVWFCSGALFLLVAAVLRR